MGKQLGRNDVRYLKIYSTAYVLSKKVVSLYYYLKVVKEKLYLSDMLLHLSAHWNADFDWFVNMILNTQQERNLYLTRKIWDKSSSFLRPDDGCMVWGIRPIVQKMFTLPYPWFSALFRDAGSLILSPETICLRAPVRAPACCALKFTFAQVRLLIYPPLANQKSRFIMLR